METRALIARLTVAGLIARDLTVLRADRDGVNSQQDKDVLLMIDEAQGMSASVESTAPVQNAAPAPQASEAPERRFSQQELNDIVKREKYGAIEDFKRSQGSSYKASESPVALTEAGVKELVAKEAMRLNEEARNNYTRQTQEQEAQSIASEFFNKLATGKERFADFDDVMDGVDYAKFPNAVQLATKYADNTADVMYELGKDRIKMAALEQLSRISPQDAIKQVQRFSAALKANETAKNTRFPREPLSQVRPTNTGTDNGNMSVADYRKKYRV